MTLSRLLHYEFRVDVTLHRDDECESAEATRSETLRFRFATARATTRHSCSATPTASSTNCACSLSSSTSTNAASISFSRPHRPGSGEGAAFCVALGVGGAGEPMEEEEVTKLNILLVGLSHDEGERAIVADLPPILAQWRRDTEAYRLTTPQDLAVPDTDVCFFWESARFNRNKPRLDDPALFAALLEYSLPLEGQFWGVLQLATSCYILYAMGWSELSREYSNEARTVAGLAERAVPPIGEGAGELGNLFVARIAIGVVIELVELFIDIGRDATTATLRAVFTEEVRHSVVQETVNIYEFLYSTTRSVTTRLCAPRMVRACSAEGVDASGPWYFDRYFHPFLVYWAATDPHTSRDRSIPSAITSWRSYTLWRVLWTVAVSVNMEKMDANEESALSEAHAALGWHVDEVYFAALTAPFPGARPLSVKTSGESWCARA